MVGFPRGVIDTFTMIQRGDLSLFAAILLLAAMVVVVGAIVFVERGQRRIPVQYAKRVVGRRVYGGQTTHLPLRVNTAGVIPVIFASSIIAFPQTVASFFQAEQRVDAGGRRAAALGHAALQPALRRRSSSSSATSTRRSSSTRTTSRRTCASTAASSRASGRASAPPSTSTTSSAASRSAARIYLALVAILPEFLITGFKVAPIPLIGPALDSFLSNNNLGWITEGLHLNFYFGGTSLLIVVGVAMDTVAQVEAQLIMRHYDGFTGKGGKRIRGRR